MTNAINTKINGKYELFIPEYRALRPEWLIENGGWETKRIDAMIETVTNKDVVFDLGTEAGDISALIMKYTDCNMVLCEPNKRVYPSIKSVWQANGLKQPLDFFRGFMSDKTTITDYKINNLFTDIDINTMIPDHGFCQLYENYPDVPQVTLDDYCAMTGIYPTALTIDIEGAEWNFVKGAQKTLKEKKPIIFMSIHPEFLYESYRNEGEWKEKFGERCFAVHMIRFINELGYQHEVIEWDYHEIHVAFIPKD